MNSKQWDRLAKNYHEEVVSPFYGKVKNPLFQEISKIKNKKNKSVAEFGCGLFYLGEFLKNNFKEVHASDFSKNMVSQAKKRNPGTKIKQEDITKLNYKDKFDVVISVNSVIMPCQTSVHTSLQNIYKSLKSSGTLLLILPSMESILYHGMLQYDKELKNKSINAVKSAKRKIENSKYDFFLGHYNDGNEIQKFFYEHEINYLLKKAKFKDIKINKVQYPWGEDISDYEDFPTEEPLWDWFIRALKS
jgi:trans-aconitate methyltransferase